MASSRLQRTRPAHAPGPTYLAYTPNGRKLITVGSNDAYRVFEHASQGEPATIDDCHDSNTAVVSANDFFVTGSEDGFVCKYSLETNSLDEILTRCTVPIRDLALSSDFQWVAVASDELEVKVVKTTDMSVVKYIRDLPKPAKHIAFDYKQSDPTVAISCSDGIVYFYSIGEEEPRLVRKVDGLIRALETDVDTSAAVEWHPDGRAFCAPTGTRDVQVMSTRDWERQRAFKAAHAGDITALAWSPNGAMLVTAGMDRTICLWETKTQKVLAKYDDIRANVLAFSWHPVDNTLSYTTTEGELHIHVDFVPAANTSLLELGLQPAPFIHDPLKEISGNAQNRSDPQRQIRKGTPDTLDDILGPDEDDDLDGFIEDDENGAPQVNGFGKRSNGHLDPYESYGAKRRSIWQPEIHESFQPGSTPWRGNRRYLCLNLIGFVWTVDQDTHSTVTVEFYDREFQRDFHFTDPFGYDKACLSEKGSLFASSSRSNQAAQIYYRPHEHWTSDRSDWRASLPRGEEVTAIALSDSFITVATSANYVRVYTLFGTPFKVYRQKCAPMVTCASWRDYVLTMGNGAVGADGRTQLVYSIENVKRDDVCQNEDVVALPSGVQIQNVFFSDAGDPYIYDTNGVLLVLRRWRTPSAAQWTPLLDTRNLSRLATGRKEETYWPVAVSDNKFYCIILKGGDRYPYFPRPLLNEFDFEVPLRDPQTSEAHENGDSSNTNDEARRLEETYVRTAVLHSLQDDLVSSTNSTAAQRAGLAEKQLDIDKTLLQLLAAECMEGEEKGMKALEICGLMKDRTGKILDAALKVASRFGRDVLGEKIRELAERRLVGLDDDES